LDRQQDPKGETHVGKYLASWQWQPLDSTGTIWRDLRVYLFDLLRIFRSCQGRGREFESRFPLQSSRRFISHLSAQLGVVENALVAKFFCYRRGLPSIHSRLHAISVSPLTLSRMTK
jgi:hypothetical protein